MQFSEMGEEYRDDQRGTQTDACHRYVHRQRNGVEHHRAGGCHRSDEIRLLLPPDRAANSIARRGCRCARLLHRRAVELEAAGLDGDHAGTYDLFERRRYHAVSRGPSRGEPELDPPLPLFANIGGAPWSDDQRQCRGSQQEAEERR